MWDTVMGVTPLFKVVDDDTDHLHARDSYVRFLMDMVFVDPLLYGALLDE